MAATVKTLLEHHGELYWGTRKANPGYCATGWRSTWAQTGWQPSSYT